MNHPDYNAQEVSEDTVVEALQQRGCCVLRSLISLDVVEIIRQRIAVEYDLLDAKFANHALSEEEYRHCYRYGIVRPFEHEYLLSDGRAMSTVMLQCVQQTILAEVYRKFFQDDALNMLIPSSHARRVHPKDAVPFHQDSSVMKLHQVQFLNSWFPLDPAGVDAPSVEMYPVAQRECWPSGWDNDGSLYGHLRLSPEQIAERLPSVEIWSPVLFPGDVLLLHSYTVHRTHVRSDMTKSRRDFEMRFGRRAVLQSRTDIAQYSMQSIL